MYEKKIDFDFSRNKASSNMGKKSRNAGTTGHRNRSCNKPAQRNINDTTLQSVGGRGSRSSKRRAHKDMVNRRIEILAEHLRKEAIEANNNENAEHVENTGLPENNDALNACPPPSLLTEAVIPFINLS